MKNKKALIARIARNLIDKQKSPGKATLPSAQDFGSATRASGRDPGWQTDESAEVAAPTRATGTGKQAAFWLDDEDRAIFHETGMLLYTQGIKPSHNLVLRAAIRMIPRDHRLIEKVRELIEKDGRKLRHLKG